MRAPRPPSGPLIFNHSYNAEQVRLIVGCGVCRVAPVSAGSVCLSWRWRNGPRGTKGLAAPARLHRHDELTALQPEPGRPETAGGAAWTVAARCGSRSVTSLS